MKTIKYILVIGMAFLSPAIFLKVSMAININETKQMLTTDSLGNQPAGNSQNKGPNPVSQVLDSRYLSEKRIPTVKLDSIESYESDMEVEQWIKTSTQKFIYDGSMRLSEIIENTPVSGGTEIINHKTSFTYNKLGLVDSICYWNVYTGTTLMGKFWLNTVEYDALGRIKTLKNFDNLDIKWNLYQKFLFEYNEDNLLEKIFLTTESSGYSFSTLYEFAYGSDKIISEELIITESELGNFSIKYAYEPSENLISSVINGRDNYLQTHDFDINGKLCKTIFSLNNLIYVEKKYDTPYKSELVEIPFDLMRFYLNDFWDYWEMYHLKRGIYNLTESFSSFISFPAFFSLSDNNQDGNLVSEVNFNRYNFWYPFREKLIFHYSQVPTTGIENKASINIQIFPNPASDYVTFSWPPKYDKLNLKLFQLNGICVLEKEISTNESIDVQKLTKGIYLFKLSDNQQFLKSGKLVIK